MLEALASKEGLWCIGEVLVEGKVFIDGWNPLRLQEDKNKISVKYTDDRI